MYCMDCELCATRDAVCCNAMYDFAKRWIWICPIDIYTVDGSGTGSAAEVPEIGKEAIFGNLGF
jgi:hypothetical protein